MSISLTPMILAPLFGLIKLWVAWHPWGQRTLTSTWRGATA